MVEFLTVDFQLYRVERKDMHCFIVRMPGKKVSSFCPTLYEFGRRLRHEMEKATNPFLSLCSMYRVGRNNPHFTPLCFYNEKAHIIFPPRSVYPSISLSLSFSLLQTRQSCICNFHNTHTHSVSKLYRERQKHPHFSLCTIIMEKCWSFCPLEKSAGVFAILCIVCWLTLWA